MPDTLTHILLADDDNDDRFFFEKALKTLSFQTQLTTVVDGVELMNYLLLTSGNLPQVLFLDYNMPRKTGFECLLEIGAHSKLNGLPTIIYSTYVHEDVANELYNNGAYYYVRKTELPNLKRILNHVLMLMKTKRFVRPRRDKFILSALEAQLTEYIPLKH